MNYFYSIVVNDETKTGFVHAGSVAQAMDKIFFFYGPVPEEDVVISEINEYAVLETEAAAAYLS